MLRILKVAGITIGIIAALVGSELLVSYAVYDINSNIDFLREGAVCIKKEMYDPQAQLFEDQRSVNELNELALAKGYKTQVDEKLQTILLDSGELDLYFGKDPQSNNWIMGGSYGDCKTPNLSINKKTKEVLRNLNLDSDWVKFNTFGSIKTIFQSL